MRDPEKVEEARLALGRQLARLRQAAGYSQHDFAPLTHYGRSTIANVEVGRQNVPRDFWLRCDDILDARGALTAAFDALEAQRREHPRQTVEVPVPPDENLSTTLSAAADLDTSFGIVQRMQYAASSNIDEMTLLELEKDVASVIRDYERLGPHLMAPRVVARRRWVHEIMQGRQLPRQTTRLHLSASRLSGVLAVIALASIRGSVRVPWWWCRCGNDESAFLAAMIGFVEDLLAATQKGTSGARMPCLERGQRGVR